MFVLRCVRSSLYNLAIRGERRANNEVFAIYMSKESSYILWMPVGKRVQRNLSSLWSLFGCAGCGSCSWSEPSNYIIVIAKPLVLRVLVVLANIYLPRLP